MIIQYLKYIGAETGYKRNAVVEDMLPVKKNCAYLDVGCGDAELTLERAKKLLTRNVWGIEVLDSEIKKAKAKKIIIKKSDLNDKLLFNDKQFDIITATQVIEHLYDIDVFVSEIYRMLKPGGILIISTENLSAWHNIFALILGLQPSAGPFISNKFSIGFHPLSEEHKKDHERNPYLKNMAGHTRVMAYQSFKKLFKYYGFELILEKGVGYYPFPSFISDFFTKIDRWHALDIVLKLRKA